MTMNTHVELKETAAYQAVRMRATGIANTIWAAATEVMAQIECATLDADEATTVQLDNMIRAHLANIYPELLGSDDLPNIQTKRLRVELDTSSQPRSQVWRPTRPALARGIAMLIEDGMDVVEAPAGKRLHCILPFKMFAKDVVAKLKPKMKMYQCAYTDRSIGYAVSETMAAIVAEAETSRKLNSEDLNFELHSSTEMAWPGTSARGSGIAMDESGKAAIEAAAGRVGRRLAQPELHITKRAR
jgi:hypothetical protein